MNESSLVSSQASAAQSAISDLATHLNNRLVGRETLIERLLIALLVRGHVLIEGPPGLAKTRAVRNLAQGVDVDFVRVQCTPDLLPADLTGTTIYRPQSGDFEFSKGPLFSHVVLVDEINRAPPKVQSALLEAMAEKQISVAGITYALEEPFIVIATQNPIEHEGTYPLPEAQLDRFIFMVDVALPDSIDEELRILNLVESETQSDAHNSINTRQLTRQDITKARHAVNTVHLSDAVKQYIVTLVTATRPGMNDNIDLTDYIDHPASPRGSLALASGARARAWLNGRDYVLPEDVTELAPDALSARLVLSYKARAEGITARDLIQQLLAAVPVV